MREIKEDGWMPVDRRKNVGIIKLLAYIENMGHLEAHYLKKCQQRFLVVYRHEVLWYMLNSFKFRQFKIKVFTKYLE